MSDPQDAYAVAQERARSTLQSIADALGVSTEVFMNKADRADALSELAARSELLELWGRLQSDTDRAKVLAVLRGLVQRRT